MHDRSGTTQEETTTAMGDCFRTPSGGWWLRLIYCERKILLAGWWLVLN
jgi:hypothetical protein